ncbi:uvrD-like helicase C-terminal domain protein [Mycobacterium xenopi 3993]|nr:uvrD-like helicase C-terminal domain protein [Mycobacterium xenopi 3993]
MRGVLEPLGLTTRPPAGARPGALGGAGRAGRTGRRRGGPASTTGFARSARRASRARRRPPSPVVQGVTLASLHAAKGLEWDAVFLVGLTDGTLPISHALAHGATSEPVEEERRLFYVGITRARVHLALSWARSRNPADDRAASRRGFSTGSPRRLVPTGRRAHRGAVADPCRGAASAPVC